MDASNTSGPTGQLVQDLQGRRFYSPGMIAIYSVLSLPIGICLYGLNIARRGERVMGLLLFWIYVVMFLVMITAGAMGSSLSGFSILGTFMGIGLFNMERAPYGAAVSRGGLKARWWPPLLWWVGCLVAVAIVVAEVS